MGLLWFLVGVASKSTDMCFKPVKTCLKSGFCNLFVPDCGRGRSCLSRRIKRRECLLDSDTENKYTEQFTSISCARFSKWGNNVKYKHESVYACGKKHCVYTFHALVNRYAVVNKCSQNKPRYPLGSWILIYLVDWIALSRPGMTVCIHSKFTSCVTRSWSPPPSPSSRGNGPSESGEIILLSSSKKLRRSKI